MSFLRYFKGGSILLQMTVIWLCYLIMIYYDYDIGQPKYT